MDECEEIENPPMKYFLTAEELVSLRKNPEPSVRPVVGEKQYNNSETWLENKALQCVLESYNDSLARKRCARRCDLVQAEWNETLNAVVVPKLKGKFVQHMGHMIEGKIVLSPEEAVFLLENGSIEIINGNIPMSTEDSYSTILVGNLGIEKYQVYSYLSQLGFIVVPHQTELGMTNYEKKMKLNKLKLNNKRKNPCSPNEESAAKRLNFAGAFSDKPDTSIALGVSVCNDDEEKETVKVDNSVTKENVAPPSDVVTSLLSKNSEVPVLFPEIDPNSASCEQNENSSPPVLENNKRDSILSNVGNQLSVDKNEVSNFDLSEDNIPALHTENEVETSFPDNEFSLEEAHSTEIKDKDICQVGTTPGDILIMDIDSQSTELSCDVPQISKDTTSPVKNLQETTDSVVGLAEPNSESNCDILTCSSEESDVLSMGVESDDSLTQNVDEDVTLIEVKKKETKPLAVIDLMSDDEEERTEREPTASDDEIMVVSESSGSKAHPSTSSISEKKPKLKSEFASSPFHHFKSEGRLKTEFSTTSRSQPPFKVEFPKLFRKDVVCIPRPPVNLLPAHVKPAKEVYVLDLKQNRDSFSQGQGRLWNSFRDMQDYQRSRRQHRNSGQPFPPFQDSKAWNRNSWDQQCNFSNGQSPSHDVNRNINNTQNSPSFGPQWMPFPQQPPYPLPNANTIVGTRHQQVNVSMIQSLNPYGNQNFLPQGPSMSNNYIRTVHSIAHDVVSVIFNSHLNTFRPPVNAPSYNTNGAYRSYTPSSFNSNFNTQGRANENFNTQGHLNENFIHHNRPRRFYLPRIHRGRPFPCHYNNAGEKNSWEQVKMSIGEENPENEGSDIEEVPINPTDILWDPVNVCPLVKPDMPAEPSTVLKCLQIIEMAKLTEKASSNKGWLPDSCSLEISFDVYLPGFNYKKSNPDVPKHRVIVLRSKDQIPKFGEIAFLQKKWNDGALLQFAVVDNGDISFVSFTSIHLPCIVPHE